MGNKMNLIAKRLFTAFLSVFISASLVEAQSSPDPVEEELLVYYDHNDYTIGGTDISPEAKECAFDRFPKSMKEAVREPVWNLSKNSAGVTVSFLTDSPTIKVKWTVLNDFEMNHMASTGIKGIDLYVLADSNWIYVNTGRPSGKENEAKLVEGIGSELREYKLFLPLYDGVTHLTVGVTKESRFEKAPSRSAKPIVFYGTSITQGGCASRPGMAHTSIISRELNREVINLGFSGNCRMEEPIIELMAQTDAEFYVIECLQNMSEDLIRERMPKMLVRLRVLRPETPIVLVDNMMFGSAILDKKIEDEILSENRLFKSVYQWLVDDGLANIFYIENQDALGVDNEATVDGVHLTDLGFKRLADHLIKNFKSLNLIN